jgi:hypothetical protein
MAKGAVPSSYQNMVNTANFPNMWLNLSQWTQHLPLEKATPFVSLSKLTSLFPHSMTISSGIPDILVTCWTLKVWVQPRNMLGMMNARGGVCIEHNLPNLPPIIERWLNALIRTQNKAHIRWIVANPYDEHWSSFVTPEASHTCLVILVPKYLTQPHLFLEVCRGVIGFSQEYHSDGAQMVLELQMMVDTVVDSSCYQ